MTPFLLASCLVLYFMTASLRSFAALLRDPTANVHLLERAVAELPYPEIFHAKLDPDGHDLITIIVERAPNEAVAVRLLELVGERPGAPRVEPVGVDAPFAGGGGGGCRAGSKDYNGQTGVFYAARDGRVEVLEYLCEKMGYRLDTVDRFSQTATFYAAREGRIEVLEYIKRKTGEKAFSAKDKNGQTPIFYACEKNCFSAVKWLVEVGGVDPEFRDNMKRTARNYASNIEIVKFLSSRGKESTSKKRKIEQTPPWVTLTKDILRISGVLNKFPSDLASAKRALERGDFEDFESFYHRIEFTLKTAPDLHDYFLQLAFATGLAKPNA